MPKIASDTDYFYLELKEGIIHFQHKPGTIDLTMAKKIVEERLRLFNGRSYPLLITGEGLADISKDARLYLSSDKGTEGILAGALLSNSVFETFLGNFIIQVTRPGIPVRLFMEKWKALEWLEQFKTVNLKQKISCGSEV